MSAIIDNIYNNNTDLIKFLEDQKQVSFKIDAEQNFKKGLLLSIASLFESRLMDIIESFFIKNTKNNTMAIEFVKSKGLKRQYHTFFNWNSANANTFFALFGKKFKDQMVAKVKSDAKFDTGVKSFITLGELRNRLVHKNFAEFNIEKTANEIYNEFKQALYFVDQIEKELMK
ncbi:HEPN domain-containing protein [Muriicola sp. SD30]|uniref:HEPN domain-containing protein n=1 Tax=Muriicola sp. SD30 TaxID=3240936 RepID=UPI00350E9332